MLENQAIIFFDGVCNLCNGFVQFVIRNDKKGIFRFASLQSAEAGPYLKACNYDPEALNSVVLYQNGKCYTESSAALHIFRQLSGGWPLLFAGILIPPFLRNGLYKFVAGNRYRWFGKQESCMLPSPELKSRFL